MRVQSCCSALKVIEHWSPFPCRASPSSPPSTYSPPGLSWWRPGLTGWAPCPPSFLVHEHRHCRLGLLCRGDALLAPPVEVPGVLGKTSRPSTLVLGWPCGVGDLTAQLADALELSHPVGTLVRCPAAPPVAAAVGLWVAESLWLAGARGRWMSSWLSRHSVHCTWSPAALSRVRTSASRLSWGAAWPSGWCPARPALRPVLSAD